MPPPPIQPDSILEYVPKADRVLKVDANVIAYFGDLFHAFQEGLRQSPNASPQRSVHTSPASTASAHNPS